MLSTLCRLIGAKTVLILGDAEDFEVETSLVLPSDGKVCAEPEKTVNCACWPPRMRDAPVLA